MSSRMAWTAQSNAVVGIVADLGVRPPWLDVVNVETPAVSVAILTGPVVAEKTGISISHVSGTSKVCVAERRVSPLPVRMFRADEMRVSRRSATSESRPLADGRPMFSGQCTPAQSRRDVATLGLRQDPPGSRRLPGAGGADLRACVRSLRRIVAEVRPSRPAGVRAETQPSRLIRLFALFAGLHQC